MKHKFYSHSEPCSQVGCLSSLHPCVGCGRTAGKGEAFEGEGKIIKNFEEVRRKVLIAVRGCPTKVSLEQAMKQIKKFNASKNE